MQVSSSKKIITAVVALIINIPALAGVRQEVYEALDGIDGNWPDASLVVTFDGSEPKSMTRVGESIQYRVESTVEGFFTLVHVDSHGTTSLILPACGEKKVCLFPEQGALKVQPPLGKETLYAILTDKRVSESELGIEPGRNHVQKAGTAELAERLATVLEGKSGTMRITIEKLEYLVEGELGSTQYTTRAIIREFEDGLKATAPEPVAVKKALSSSMIHFELGSAELTTQGKINLDVFGEAFLSGALQNQVYILAGHTDDTGQEQFNEWLSMERAKSAKAYLVDHFGIKPERIQIKGFGSANPLAPNLDDESRAMNRRVEFVRIQ